MVSSDNRASNDLRVENQMLREELEESRAATRRYMQNLAHQLISPLTAIRWAIEGAKSTERISARERLDMLEAAERQATLLVHLINNFRLMSRLEDGSGFTGDDEDWSALDLWEFVNGAIRDYRVLASERGIEISMLGLSLRKASRYCEIRVIDYLAKMALSNVLANAVSYSDAGTVITVGGVRDEEKRLVGVEVASMGVSIKPEEIKQVFRRGFRGRGAAQKRPAGTGVGLFLVQRIMELHSGEATVSAQGKQSSFSLLFPCNGGGDND